MAYYTLPVSRQTNRRFPLNRQIHGHRGGAGGQRPENTLPAIALGLQQGADGIEVDLCVTRDNLIVLHHDLHIETKDPTGKWNEQIPVRCLTLNELREHYEHKDAAPTLADCIEFIHRSAGDDVILNLELKSNPRQRFLTPERGHYAHLVTEQLKSLPFPSARVFLQSFDWKLMETLKKQQTKQNLNWKIGLTKRRAIPGDPKRAKKKGGDILSYNHRNLTQPLIQQTHDLGLKVCAWTVNEEADIERMAESGVDIITTDFPQKCRAVIYGSG